MRRTSTSLTRPSTADGGRGAEESIKHGGEGICPLPYVFAPCECSGFRVFQKVRYFAFQPSRPVRGATRATTTRTCSCTHFNPRADRERRDSLAGASPPYRGGDPSRSGTPDCVRPPSDGRHTSCPSSYAKICIYYTIFDEYCQLMHILTISAMHPVFFLCPLWYDT